jgi:uncharacterized membrane protein YkvA (DUF1232 family)
MTEKEFSMIWRTFILSFRLMLDRRVAFHDKLIPLLAVVYYFSPIDVVPDFLGAFGMVDDIGILAASLHFFINLAPNEVLREHLERLSRSDKVLRMMRDLPSAPAKKGQNIKNGDTIEGKITK